MSRFALTLAVVFLAGCGAERTADDLEAQRAVEAQIAASPLMHAAAAPAACPDVRADVAAEYVCTATIGGTDMEWVITFTPTSDDGDYDLDGTPRFATYRDYLRTAVTSQFARTVGAGLTRLDCPDEIEAVVTGETTTCQATADDVPFEIAFTIAPLEEGKAHPNFSFDVSGAHLRILLDQEVSAMMSDRLQAGVEASCDLPGIVPAEVGRQYPCRLTAPSQGQVGTGTLTFQPDDEYGFQYEVG